VGETGVQTAFVLDLLWSRVEPLRWTPLQRIVRVQDYLPFPKNVLFPVQARRLGSWMDVPRKMGFSGLKSWCGPGAPRRWSWRLTTGLSAIRWHQVPRDHL
jgi:long-chain acyl-CoA synthetase